MSAIVYALGMGAVICAIFFLLWKLSPPTTPEDPDDYDARQW